MSCRSKSDRALVVRRCSSSFSALSDGSVLDRTLWLSRLSSTDPFPERLTPSRKECHVITACLCLVINHWIKFIHMITQSMSYNWAFSHCCTTENSADFIHALSKEVIHFVPSRCYSPTTHWANVIHLTTRLMSFHSLHEAMSFHMRPISFALFKTGIFNGLSSHNWCTDVILRCRKIWRYQLKTFTKWKINPLLYTNIALITCMLFPSVVMILSNTSEILLYDTCTIKSWGGNNRMVSGRL